MRFLGYSLIAVTGKAHKPLYLYIDDTTVELRDADTIWGKTIPEMQCFFDEKFGNPQFDVMGIGPAGERLVLLANVANNIRFAGKGGSGAVMGSKNFKAVIIRGNGTAPVCDRVRLRDISVDIIESMKTCEPIQALRQGSSAAFNQTVAEIMMYYT